MTSSSGGTITIGGKTYNISQVNSVHIGTVPRHQGVWWLFLVGGFVGIFAAQASVWFWLFLTVAAFAAAVYFSNLRDYAVFFDLSSGKVSAYTNPDKEKVEAVKLDIIQGMEKGSFTL